MTYTIRTSQFRPHYANADHTAAVMDTVEASAVMVSIEDTPDLWAMLHDWGEPDAYAPLEPEPPDLVAYTAVKRLEIEQGGTIWNGLPIHTDDRSQGKYTSEMAAIREGVRVDGEPWKFADGIPRPVSNADMRAMAIKARDHVKQAFSVEFDLLTKIGAEIVSTEQIDAAFTAAMPDALNLSE